MMLKRIMMPKHKWVKEVTASEMIEQINDHPTHWLFVDGEMVSREQITNLNWDNVEMVDLTPAIVGGAL